MFYRVLSLLTAAGIGSFFVMFAATFFRVLPTDNIEALLIGSMLLMAIGLMTKIAHLHFDRRASNDEKASWRRGQ